jgi:hypothetical protein
VRELTRCIAWTLALGAAALLVAAFAGRGLAHADGMAAWAVFLIYSPFYLLGHAFGTDSSHSPGVSAFDAAAFGAQFLYFFALVAGVRFFYRRRTRRGA